MFLPSAIPKIDIWGCEILDGICEAILTLHDVIHRYANYLRILRVRVIVGKNRGYGVLMDACLAYFFSADNRSLFQRKHNNEWTSQSGCLVIDVIKNVENAVLPCIKSIDDSKQKYKRKLAERQVHEPGSLPLPKYAGVYAKLTRVKTFDDSFTEESGLTNDTMNEDNGCEGFNCEINSVKDFPPLSVNARP